jgi:GTP:adenosylcobinamide-phosphate guanylyltransferase
MEVMKKTTLEKIFEYASMPLHGTLSRKLRKDISVQVNEEKIYSGATLFLGEEFVRITETEKAVAVNTYYDWDHISSVRTIAKLQE